jgi:integrase
MARQQGRGSNKTGTIYQDRHGKWWAQLPADEYGKRPKRSARIEADAVLLLAELEKERALGLNPGEQDPTVAQHLDNWLELDVRPNVKASTYEDRVWLTGRYITPAIGTIRLRKLTTAHCQRMLNDLLARPLARSTVALVRRRLITALNVAIAWKLLPPDENAARRTKFTETSADAEEGDPLQRLTAPEAQTLMGSMVGHRLYPLYFLALTYGMRQAELVGLRWIDVDLEKREIKIRTQVHRKRREIRRTKPKTPKSRRTLLIDDETVAVLRAQAENVHEERALQQRAGKWKEHGLVFPSQVGTPLFASTVWLHCKGALKRAGLPPIPFHGLRHTAASVMLERGVALPNVSEILGHANAGITARLYLHGSDEGKRAAAETMTSLFRRAR